MSVAAQGQSFSSAAAPSVPILAGCELDYPPYCIVTADQKADGFSVELLRAALKAMGKEVAFKTGPWAELKQDLADARIQALPLVGRTPEREAIYDFTFPYLTMHGAIVVRDGNTEIHGPADLQGKKVAVLRGDNAEEYLNRAGLGAVVVPTLSFETALQELSAGQHDAVVIQKLVAYQLMARAGLKNLITVGPPLQDFKQSFCFAVRKGNSDLLASLNEGLSLVIANGTFRALHTKWFSELEAQGRTRSQIVVSGDSDFPPYEFLDQDGRPAGFNVDLTRAIARRAGLSVDIRLGPWGSIRNRLATGTVDAVQGMFYSAERDESFSFSPPHGIVQYAIVVREDSPELSELKDLVGKSVLVMTGDIMEDLAVKQGYGARLVAVASQEEALHLLSEGKHDAALVAKVPALYWIERHGWRNLRISTHAVLSPEYCYAVPHGKDDVLAALNEGLAAVKATDEFRKIQSKWLSPYEKSGPDVRKLVRTAALVLLPVLALLLLLLFWSHSLKRQVASRTRALTAEITERKQAEAAVIKAKADAQTSERQAKLLNEKLNEAQQIAEIGSWDWDLQANTVWWSDETFRIFGVRPDEHIPSAEANARFYHPDDLEPFGRQVEHTLKTGEPLDMDLRLVLRQGVTKHCHVRACVVAELSGKPIRFAGTIMDITVRKKVEEALESSLHEKEALLKEVHHRVKNNLQVITSLLRMEARRSEYLATKSVLDEMKNRVRSMALLHESLYRTGTFASVDLGAYLKELTTQSFRASVARPGAVRLQLDLTSVQVEMDQALPCGLLVNELVSNCLKHGFPGERTGEVRIELHPVDGGPQLRLRVSDTGVGLPEDFEKKRGKSLGLQLVSDLAGQINGRLEVGPGPGAVFDVTFTLKHSEPNPSNLPASRLDGRSTR